MPAPGGGGKGEPPVPAPGGGTGTLFNDRSDFVKQMQAAGCTIDDILLKSEHFMARWLVRDMEEH